MAINPKKMLATCIPYKPESFSKNLSHWESSVILEKPRIHKRTLSASNKIFTDTKYSILANNKGSFFHDPYDEHRLNGSNKYIVTVDGSLSVLPKRMLSHHMNQNMEFCKDEINMQYNRIFQNFARPKKLVAVKSTIFANLNGMMKKNDCRILLKKSNKTHEIASLKPIESFESKYGLQKKKYFHVSQESC